MNDELEIFNYFVDDLLSSDDNLLNNELDILLMQYLFNSIELELFTDMDFQNGIMNASWVVIMQFFYEKFWVPFFGGILSKFVVLIEGKPQKVDRNIKNKSKQN